MAMIRGAVLIGFILISFIGHAQRYAVASGSWNAPSTWSDSPGGLPGFSVPTASDDVFTEGFSVTIPGGVSLACNNLYVAYNFLNGINSTFGTTTLTINGELAAYDPAIPDYAVPTTSIIRTSNANFTINFTGLANTNVINGSAWGNSAPIRRVLFNPGAGNTITIPDLVIAGSGTLAVQSGTLELSGNLQSATSSASVTVNTGSILLVSSGTISGNGSNSTKFPTLTINGTLTSQSNTTSFINSDVINLNSGGTLNVGYNGSNQTQGWWYQSNSPTTLNIDVASTVNYNSSTAQNVAPLIYGNLTLGGTGTITKTVSGSGSVNIKGILSFANTSITFTAPSSNQVFFDGTGAQGISGVGIANFNGGLQVNKSAGTLTLSQNISIQNGLTLTSGTFDFGSNTVSLSGNLSNNATLTAGASTLSITGATSVSGVTTTLNNLTVTGTGNFTAPATLNLIGNFTNNGVFNASTGNLVFNGSAAQTIGGTTNTTFYDITTSNAVSVSSAQSISGILTVSSNTFTTNGNLTLLSTASGDAAIGQVGGTISGNVTVQRYIPNSASARAYRYIASPVTGATVAAWKTSFPITGTFTDPNTAADFGGAFPTLISSNPSMYYYNEPAVGALTTRFASYPLNGNSTGSSALSNGTGYAAFIRQTTPITLSVTGGVRQGNAPVTVTNTAGDPTDDGWNLIGNPYAAPISWNNVTIPSGVSGQVSVKDNMGVLTSAGSYVTYSGGVGSPISFTGVIPSGEGFWVRRTSIGSSTITFKEADKVTTRNPTFLRKETIVNILRANLSGNGKQDELVVRLVDGALDKADNSFDAFKLKNDFLNFSSLSTDGQKMTINAESLLTVSNPRRSFPLVIEGNGSWAPTGNFKISFSELETFDNNVVIKLKDLFLKDSVELSSQRLEYAFTSTADPKTFANRFELIIARPSVTTAVEDIFPGDRISIYPNPTNGAVQIEVSKDFAGSVKVLNNLGQELGKIELVNNGELLKGSFDLGAQAAGFYFIRVVEGTKVYAKKVIKR